MTVFFMRWPGAAAFALFLVSSATFAQTPLNTAFAVGPKAEGISEYTLKANGLRVLLFPDASNPKVTVNITYLVGSRHEGYGETGMAHLLEHMLFKSTPKYPKLWQDMANRGFINNGTTCQRAMRRHLTNRFVVLEIIAKLVAVFFFAFSDFALEQTVLPQPLTHLANQARVLGPLL